MIDILILDRDLGLFYEVKRDKSCKVTIYTKKITEQIQSDTDKHHVKYPKMDIKSFEIMK